MNNYLLKFKHSNGSNVWFTVYTELRLLMSISAQIERRTSFTYLNDYEELD